MKIACVARGPGGLYFAISMKLRAPHAEIVVFERNRPGDTFGWGVVFSDQTMENLRANDPVSAGSMSDELAHWDDIDVHVAGTKVTSSATASSASAASACSKFSRTAPASSASCCASRPRSIRTRRS